jgi:hypothetical protein
MIVRRGGVPGIGAFHRQAVPCERIGGLGGDEVFEDLAARLLLWLGQGHAHSIFALEQNAKCQRESVVHRFELWLQRKAARPESGRPLRPVVFGTERARFLFKLSRYQGARTRQ